MSDIPPSSPVPDVVMLPDIPMPMQAPDESVRDEISPAPAFKFSFIGLGQGGGRLAQSFWSMGYRRVCAINTALQDLDGLDELPAHNKMDLATHGAGKDPSRAAQTFRSKREEIYDFIAERFGSTTDRIIICAGAGGGTGNGGLLPTIEICHEWVQARGLQQPSEGPRIGVILALPQRAESRRVQASAYTLLRNISAEGWVTNSISPLVLVDNQRILQIYPRVPVNQFWGMANNSICRLFHLFNLLAAQPSKHTTFDRQDMDTVLAGGITTFGATPLHQWNSGADIARAVRDNLQQNVLAGGMDLRTGTRAACLFVGAPDVLDAIPQEYLEEGFEQLRRVLKAGNVVHRGIWTGSSPGLAVYTMVSGLSMPSERIHELAHAGGIQPPDGV